MAAPYGVSVSAPAPAWSMGLVSNQTKASPPDLDDMLDADLAASPLAVPFLDEDMVGMGVSGQVDSEICAESETVAIASPTNVPEQSVVPFSYQAEAHPHDWDFSLRTEQVGMRGSIKDGSGICVTSETVAAPNLESAPEKSMVPFSDETEADTDPERDLIFSGDLNAYLAIYGLLNEDMVQGDSGINTGSGTAAASITASRSLLPMPNQEMQSDATTLLVELPGNRTLVPLGDKTIYHALDVIAGTMFGSSKYIAIKRSGYDLVKELQGRLPQCLKELQKKRRAGIEEALKLLPQLLLDKKKNEKELEELGETPAVVKKWKDNEEDINKILDNVYIPISLRLTNAATDAFLPSLLSDFLQSLKDIKEMNNFVVTLGEVKNEASKLIYFQMGGEKPAAHPEHIRNIPGIWRSEHPGCKKPCIQRNRQCRVCERTCYPPMAAYQSIADYTGLCLKQVKDLFQNDRKRRAPKDPELGDGQLKKHFEEDVIDKLRDWKARNPGKKLPDETTVKDLMGTTGMDKTQITNWFANNAPGRENRSNPLKRRHVS